MVRVRLNSYTVEFQLTCGWNVTNTLQTIQVISTWLSHKRLCTSQLIWMEKQTWNVQFLPKFKNSVDVRSKFNEQYEHKVHWLAYYACVSMHFKKIRSIVANRKMFFKIFAFLYIYFDLIVGAVNIIKQRYKLLNWDYVKTKQLSEVVLWAKR